VETPQGKPELPPPQGDRVRYHNNNFNTCMLSVSNPCISERMDDTPVEVRGRMRSDSACYISNQMVPQYPSTPPTYAKKHKDTLDGEEKENAKQCNTFH